MSNMTPHFFGNFWTTLIFGPDRAVSRAEPSRVNRPESQKGDSFPEIVLTHEKNIIFHSKLHSDITFHLLNLLG